jgi:proline iminopeptidase
MTTKSFGAAAQLSVDIQGKGFPILCLHGHPGSGGSLSVFTHHLSQRFQTIAPDLRVMVTVEQM